MYEGIDLECMYEGTDHRDALGKKSGVNFIAACMFPLIFILPCIKAV